MAILATFWSDVTDVVDDIWTDVTAIGRVTTIASEAAFLPISTLGMLGMNFSLPHWGTRMAFMTLRQ